MGCLLPKFGLLEWGAPFSGNTLTVILEVNFYTKILHFGKKCVVCLVQLATRVKANDIHFFFSKDPG